MSVVTEIWWGAWSPIVDEDTGKTYSLLKVEQYGKTWYEVVEVLKGKPLTTVYKGTDPGRAREVLNQFRESIRKTTVIA